MHSVGLLFHRWHWHQCQNQKFKCIINMIKVVWFSYPLNLELGSLEVTILNSKIREAASIDNPSREHSYNQVEALSILKLIKM